jgi:hypothetical protein
MRAFADFILRNPFNAILVAGLFGILALKIPPFCLPSAAALGLYALRRGWAAGALATLGAAAVVAVGWYLLGSRPGLDFPLVYALFPPLLVAAEVLRRTESQGHALLAVGLAVAAFVVAMHLATGNVVEFWHAWLQRAVAAVPGATVQGFEDNGTLRLLNGFLAVLYGLNLMLSLLFARWLQSLAFNPGGFGPEFRRLRLDKRVLFLAVAAVWLAGAGGQAMLADLLMAAMMMYFFVGLAVIHGVIAVRGIAVGWVLPLYVLLAYLPQYALSGLALLGALDAFVDFRAQRAQP